MLRVLIVASVLVPSLAVASPRRAITRDDHRVDREIGDGNGWLDDLELAVARASYDVFRTTGMNIRPRLAHLKNAGGLATHDAYGPRVYICRCERVETVAFTVFHEAGHVAYRHDLYPYGSKANELWADEYAGRILAAVGGDVRAAIADYRSRGDALHGTGDERASVLLMGYLRNHGRIARQRNRNRLDVARR
jgi:hypothetical protein